MDSNNHHSAPEMAPYQRALKPSGLSHSPSYPSPARSDSAADGLGLLNFPLPISESPRSSSLYPPSPQPTEAWTHLSTGASPLMTEAPVESWQSIYEAPPVARSPQGPWPNHTPYPHPASVLSGRPSPEPFRSHASNRSSLSSTRDVSIYSHEGSEHGFPAVKLEAGPEWHTDDESSGRHGHSFHQQPLTVSPDRLSNHAYSYPYYGSPPVVKYEAPAEEGYGYGDSAYEGGRRRSSRGKEHSTQDSTRTRARRNRATGTTAQYVCEFCGKGFERRYNHKSHLSTHDPHRGKPNECEWANCNQSFYRRTDLLRHQQSVHLKARNFKCNACGAKFSRRDTLQRHETDGCSKRNAVSQEVYERATTMRNIAVSTRARRYHAPPPDLLFSYPSRSPSPATTPLFRDTSYPGSP